MIKLTDKEQEVRKFLIDLCRKTPDQTIYYQHLSNACGLGLELSKGPHSDQTVMGNLLDRIARYENDNDRPLLSAPVVLADKEIQGKGFFELANQLGIREEEEAEHPMLKEDKRFCNAMIAKCRTYWRDDEYYANHYEIPESDKE